MLKVTRSLISATAPPMAALSLGVGIQSTKEVIAIVAVAIFMIGGAKLLL
jgi:hypothetical protein